MGTRGLVGCRYENKDYLTYNHFDSYPEYLGANFVKLIRDNSYGIKKLKEKLTELIPVDDDDIPEPKWLEHYKILHNSTVNEKIDWYAILRNAQGVIYWSILMNGEYGEIDNIGKVTNFYRVDILHIPLDNDFIKNSLYCEWAYILNFDTNKLEVWKGFQKKPQERNRYGQENIGDYYPCVLIAEFDLKELPKPDEFVEHIEKVVS